MLGGMPGKLCRVSFRRADGGFCSIEVEADSAYEAAVIALSTLTANEFSEGVEPDTRLRVQVLEPGPMSTLAFADLTRWLERPSLTASELAAKRRLRGLLAS
jgi:hypothetical protein